MTDIEPRPPFSLRWRRFGFRIVVPTVLVVLLFVVTIFAIVLPTLRSALMDQKRETIRQLTNSAWSILAEYHAEEEAGLLTREEAQRLAIGKIDKLRYGKEGKDYFWVTDLGPRMIVHPYRKDLNGTDVSGFRDPEGTVVFQEFVDVAREHEEGYVQYYWQWKDNPERIVPKESYVKLFEPWEWVIGTGIYLEDVREEISRLTNRLVYFCLGVTVLLALILVYIDRESLKIERQRSNAEQGLREWNEKYRALVEAATEGVMMVLEGQCAYHNKTIAEMLGYTDEEFGQLGLRELLPKEEPGTGEGARHLEALLSQREAPPQFETRIRAKDGGAIEMVVTSTPISFEGKTGFILIARDISRQHSLEEELGETRAKYLELAEKIDVGIFRATYDRNPRFLELNAAARRIFGLEEVENPTAARLLDTLHGEEERRALAKALTGGQPIRNRAMEVKSSRDSVRIISLSVVRVDDEAGNAQYLDGMVEDITARKKSEAERESLLEELQSSLLFLNEPVKKLLRPLITCPMQASVRRAAELMTRNESSAIAIVSEDGTTVGILTDRDIRARVLAGAGDIEIPAYQAMTSPIVSVPETALVYEALLTIQQHAIRHLAIRDGKGAIAGIIPMQSLMQSHSSSGSVLIQEIRSAGSIEAITDTRARLPRIVKTLTDSGAKARAINRIVTRVSDSIVERLVQMGIDQLGMPPCRFAFVALGSEGRAEQTLATDQDNAIIFENIEKHRVMETKQYFLNLGEFVCDGLASVGYAYCIGNVMAKNPKWIQSLDGWRDTFATWIRTANPQDLLEFNMFFDFRSVYGDGDLVQELRASINGKMKSHPPFFLHFAQNTLIYKPPIGFLGKIVVESSGDSPKTLDIKEAMLPFVNYSRLYALREQIEETNTLDRLERLHERGVFQKSTYEECLQAYDFLMRIRLDHQATAMNEGRKPDNFIDPKALTQMEETMLKQSFGLISDIRKKISYDFLGMA